MSDRPSWMYGDTVDLAFGHHFNPAEPRDGEGRWRAQHDAQRLGAPLEKTTEELFKAKNTMAKAALSKNPRKTKSAEKKLAKAAWAHLQYLNAQATSGSPTDMENAIKFAQKYDNLFKQYGTR